MERFKNFIRKVVQNEISTLILRLLILYVILFITKIIFYFYNKEIVGEVAFHDFFRLLRGSFVFDTISIFYINLLFILLSVIPFYFRTREFYQKFLFWLYTITNSLAIVLLNLIDVIYFHYSLKRITSEELHFTNYQNTLPIMLKESVNSFWIVLVAIILIVGMIYFYKKIPYFTFSLKKRVHYYSVHSVIFIVVILVLFGGMRGGFKLKLRPYNLCNAAQYTQKTQQSYLILSNPFCLFRTIGAGSIEELNYFSEMELEEIFSPYHFPSDSLRYNLEGRNIVLFILESFSKEHSKFYNPDLYPAEDGYTPFLDSLMAEGYVFTNAYANGLRSIEALPSILTSIPSYKAPFVMLPQSLGNLEGFPTILKNLGYSTSFFCGTEKNSMFFEAYASMAGIENFYAKDEYMAECAVNENTIEPFWGVYDMPFFLFMADKIDEMEEPFCVTSFNLTSHHPFRLPSDYADKMPQGHTLVQPCVAYSDLSIRKFFEKSSQKPWFKNTIFIFIADHVSPEIYAPQTCYPRGRMAIFYFLYTPDKVLQGLDPQVTQQLDVMPTLLGLLGYDKPYFSFGRDVFNEPERFSLATSYINEVYQGIADSLTIYFDGEKVISAFAADDIFQENNLLNNREVDAMERNLKAILQSYYQQLKKQQYIVPHDAVDRMSKK